MVFKKLFFLYLIEDLTSSAMVEKYMFKTITVAVGSVRVALFSMMEFGDV